MSRNAARLTQDELASLRAATTLSSSEARDLIDLASEPSSTIQRPGVSSDEVMARRLWQGELNAFARTLDDRQLAVDLTTAQREGRTLEAVKRRREAAANATKTAPAASTTTTRTTTTPTSPPIQPRPDAHRSQCVICLDSVDLTPVAFTAPCSHRFCQTCLEAYYLNAVKDESLFPPKCCGFAIHPLNSIGSISKSVREAYYKAAKEYGTKDRVYCYKPQCSAFLGGDLAEPEDLTCAECGRVTCSACKAPAVSCSSASPLPGFAHVRADLEAVCPRPKSARRRHRLRSGR